MSNSEPGPAVDAQGRPVIDPTENVKDVLEAAVRRLDDIRGLESQHVMQQLAHLRELVALRADYEEKLRLKESDRIDAIRAVDIAAAQRAAEVQQAAATVLAAQLAATAEASRTQVAAAAAAQVTSLAAALEPIQKDIRDLRDAQNANRGSREQVTERRLDMGQMVLIAGALISLTGLIITIIIVFK